MKTPQICHHTCLEIGTLIALSRKCSVSKGEQLEEKPPANNYNADVMDSHNTLVQTDEISLVSDITPTSGNYRCQYCSYSSKSNYNVKRHVMSVHEGVTYPCTFCGYKATQTTHLKSHIAKVHSKIF